jgi:hypothetical protein
MREDVSLEVPPMPEMSELSSWEAELDFNNMDLRSPYDPSCLSFPSIAFDTLTTAVPGLEFLDEIMDTEKALEPLPPVSRPLAGLEDPLSVALRQPKPQAASMSRLQLLTASSELFEQRLRYAVDVFRRAPEDMVLEGGTAWSHPAVYRDSMPAFLEGECLSWVLDEAEQNLTLCPFTPLPLTLACFLH